jgi:hypothetical protein
MKLETFYKTYANIPLTDRRVSHHYNIDGYTTTISPIEIYRNIEKSQHEISLQKEEIDRQLRIAEQILTKPK